MLPAVDLSQYQGGWIDRGESIDVIKMSGGDAGLYMDSDAAANYTAATSHGKGVGGYHFIGWTIGAVAEATYFMQAMSPLAENDVYALDIERGSIAMPADAVAYVTDMVNTIHDKIGVWPLLYMNVSTLQGYDWSSLLKNCGLWLADWNNDPAGTIPNVPIYVMQQYSDGPNYDHDEWFGPGIESFNEYGYHAANDPTKLIPVASTPVQTSTITATISSSPVVTSTATETSTSSAPVEPITPSPSPSDTDLSNTLSTGKTEGAKPTVPKIPEHLNWWQRFLQWLEI